METAMDIDGRLDQARAILRDVFGWADPEPLTLETVLDQIKAALIDVKDGTHAQGVLDGIAVGRQDAIGALTRWRNSDFSEECNIMLDRALDEIDELPAPVRRRWRHKVRRSFYTEIGRGPLQAATRPPVEGDTIVCYQAADGSLHFREAGEFEDGRFEEIRS
jgi:hypothetical protein